MSSIVLGYVWDACAASGIGGTKLLIMARLADYSNDEGMSYPGMRTIARQLRAGESTVRTAIAELEADGWLMREGRRKGNRNTSNIYTLNVDRLETIALEERRKVRELRAAKSHPPESDTSKSDPSETGGTKAFDPSESGKKSGFDPSESGGLDPSVITDPSVKRSEPSDTCTVSKKTPQENYDSDFDLCWKEYPKREGSNPKNHAFRHWKARIKEGATHAELLAGTQRYAAFCAAKGQTGTPYVMQAQRFYGTSREWENSWVVSAQPQQFRPATKPSDTTQDMQSRDYGTASFGFRHVERKS
ncbi:helix-turn-helix domain-containing protein [Pectobacterium aroidearum]|uniref:Helix-turn-helix domain-containing protein n=1 Tax=Pectobacterium aroidearum TaxID=1201031 RepID=A0AAW3SSW7_9GAMM|nr:helix-turn-helix domain-containing protein [Pectobacterium aroidearum]MBA5203067.1 helix-turn-helix domain-containing protein [Pectobacterium aroidearum]